MKELRDAKIGKGVLFSICVAIAVLYFFPINVGMFTFHFVHGNIFHLIVNMIAISTVLYKCRTIMLPVAFIVTSYIWLLSGNAIGISGIIFFMWGTRFSYDIHNTNEPAKYIAMTSLPLLVSLLHPKLSFTLHFFPFMVGGIIGFVDYVYEKHLLVKDIYKFKGHE